MASLYITEYRRFGDDSRGATMPAAYVPPITKQKIDIGGGSLNSAEFDDETRLVELHCDTVCHIAWSTGSQVKSGTRTAATTDFKRMPADTIQFFTVQPGSSVAVIEGT